MLLKILLPRAFSILNFPISVHLKTSCCCCFKRLLMYCHGDSRYQEFPSGVTYGNQRTLSQIPHWSCHIPVCGGKEKGGDSGMVLGPTALFSYYVRAEIMIVLTPLIKRWLVKLGPKNASLSYLTTHPFYPKWMLGFCTNRSHVSAFKSHGGWWCLIGYGSIKTSEIA